MKYKGAIFDMDGLLFDTERIFQETWNEIADERHIKLCNGFVKAISGTNGDYMCRVIEKYYKVSDGAVIMTECLERVKEKLSVNVPVKKGVYEILNFFREKDVRMAVASSSPKNQIVANLKNAGIYNYFTKVVSGTEVKKGKPAPDIFLYASAGLGCVPEECFIFEDSENGIKAGYEAGCVTVMIPDLLVPTYGILPYCSKICQDLKKAQEEIKKFYF